MTEPAAAIDPRWGQVDRDKKALAILRTVQKCTRVDVAGAFWIDIGCGSGGVADTLAQHAGRVLGVDPERWDRWQEYMQQRPNLSLLRGSYRDLPALAGNGVADVVSCNQVYEHVDDAIALLDAIRNVLKPGGACYFAGPNLLWPIEPHVFWPFVHWLPREFAQRSMRALGSRRAHDLDAWSWSYWRLTSAFRAAGFRYRSAIPERIAAQAEISGSAAARAAAKLPAAVGRWLTPLAPGFVFVLEKPA